MTIRYCFEQRRGLGPDPYPADPYPADPYPGDYMSAPPPPEFSDARKEAVRSAFRHLVASSPKNRQEILNLITDLLNELNGDAGEEDEKEDVSDPPSE